MRVHEGRRWLIVAISSGIVFCSSVTPYDPVYAQSGQDCNYWLVPEEVDATLDFWETATASKVQRCLETGANLRAQSTAGSTVLHAAAVVGNAEAAKALLAAGASVNARNRHGMTPLHFAAQNANVETVKLLIAAGANVRAEAGKVTAPGDRILGPRGGETPLHLATGGLPQLRSKFFARIWSELEKMGVDPGDPHVQWKMREVRDRWGLEMAKTLIAAGANINARDPEGMTPLSNAVHFKMPETAKGLINAGAMLDVKDIWGNTALSRAVTIEGAELAAIERAELVDALLAAGADACVRDAHGKTMFDILRARQPDMRGTDAWRRLQRAVQSC